MKFNTLNINETILKALEEKGYTDTTPIQEKAIPHALLGKDVLGCAQTGTGKTASFLVPTIQRFAKHDSTKIRGLVLTPTRELAIQIDENFAEYAKYTGLKSAVIFGGVAQKQQEKAIRQGADIVIATPGRLLDLMKQKIIRINEVETFILDEADRMLDMGFLNDVKKIIACLPKKKQTLFFSATMPKQIRELTEELLQDPVIVEVTPPSTTVETIEQSLYYVDKANKKNLLIDLLKKEKIESSLVFTRTKNNANRLGKFLELNNIKVGILHGNKSQTARQIALSKFKNGEIKVLVATDIAARGIDISELSHVFNYDIPTDTEAYVHRIGRTGRAGKNGTSISFADVDELDLVKNIQKLIGLKIPVVREHKYPMMITEPTPKKKQSKPARRPNTNKPHAKKESKDSNVVDNKKQSNKSGSSTDAPSKKKYKSSPMSDKGNTKKYNKDNKEGSARPTHKKKNDRKDKYAKSSSKPYANKPNKKQNKVKD